MARVFVVNQPVTESTSHSTIPPTNQPDMHSLDQLTARPSIPVNQPIVQPVIQPVNKSTNCFITRTSKSTPINQLHSTTHPVYQLPTHPATLTDKQPHTHSIHPLIHLLNQPSIRPSNQPNEASNSPNPKVESRRVESKWFITGSRLRKLAPAEPHPTDPRKIV